MSLLTSLLAMSPPSAHAAGGITLVRKSAEAAAGGSQITVTLPAATTAGDLLVAITQDLNSGCTTDSWSAPAGWAAAASACRGTTGPLKVWYLANTPAGTTSVTFGTGSTGANSVAEVSEWSGVSTVSPLDQTGTFDSNGSSSTSLTVATGGAIAASNELAISAFDTSAGLSSLTPGTGWTSIVADAGNGHASAYLVSPTSGSVLTSTMTSSPQTTWAAATATFRAACAAGGLTIKTSPTVSFPSVALNGYDRTSTQTATLTLDDESNTGSGWNLTAASTALDAGSGRTLPASATRITGASVAAATGNCSLPSNSVGYPQTVTISPTSVKLFNAATGTGKGPVDVTLTAVVAVPANARTGTYTSTWTFTLASGP